MSSPLGPDSAAASRKRLIPSTPVYSPNETLNQMTQEAEARQQDKYAVQKEIRAIRAQEMEKQRKEDEEKERDRDEAMSRFNRSTNNNTSQSPHLISSKPPRAYQSSSTSSTPSRFDDGANENPRELKKKLLEMEEKYKKHAIFQTQFENDNQKLLYEVDLLKDLLEEHEELIIELRRQFKDKSRELDYQKRSYKDLQTDFARLKEILKQRDTLIEDSGLVLYTDNEMKKQQLQKSAEVSSNSHQHTNGGLKTNMQPKNENEIKSVLPAALVAPETAKLLNLLGEGTIDDKLRRLIYEKQELKEQNSRLKIDIDDERNKIAQLEKKLLINTTKAQDNQDSTHDLHEIQRQYTKETNDLKMKLQKIEHENIVIKQDKQRLDTQLKYLQTNFDELEQTERRLIKEKRETQRELNESKMNINDLQLKLEVLQKTLEKKRQTIKFVDTTTGSMSSFTPSTVLTSTSVSSSSSNNNIASSLASASMPSAATAPASSLAGGSSPQTHTNLFAATTNGSNNLNSTATPPPSHMNGGEAKEATNNSSNRYSQPPPNGDQPNGVASHQNGDATHHQNGSTSNPAQQQQQQQQQQTTLVKSESSSPFSNSSASSSSNTSPSSSSHPDCCEQPSQPPAQQQILLTTSPRDASSMQKQKNLLNELTAQANQAANLEQFKSLKLDGN